MAEDQRRNGDRRFKVERRKSTTDLLNDFVGYYGPERRMRADRRNFEERRR